MGSVCLSKTTVVVVMLAVAGILGQACSTPPKAVAAKTEAVLPSPKSDLAGFVSDEAKCNGTLVPKFTQAQLGDAPEPEPSLLPNHPMIASVRFYHCMENDTDPSQQYPVGIEVAMLKNGSAVIIRHSGFEYIAQRWIVVLPEDKHDVTDAAVWIQQVDALTSVLKPAVDKPSQSMLGFVHQAITNPKDPMTGFEQEKTISIGEVGDFNSTVSVVRAWQMSEAKGRAVEFTVNYGPL